MDHISLRNHPVYILSSFLSYFFITFLKHIFLNFYLSKKRSNAHYEKAHIFVTCFDYV
jgi:hypothetical protein